MKFRVTFKDPDGPHDCIRDELNIFLDQCPETMCDDEKRAAADVRHERMLEALNEWCEYGEYVTIEIDTTEGTATVIR